MSVGFRLSLCAVFLAVSMWAPGASAQLREPGIVESVTNTLNEFIVIPNQNIPQSLLARAEGLVIIPGMIKVGLIGGVRRGKGVVLIRDQNRSWKPPLFATMTGGSVGWQAGIQSTDVILVLLTRRSVSGLLSGKFTIGADATAAAGPVGRQAAAATDASLQAEILSYSRSRGLFAGVSVDGSVLQIDAAANQAYYSSAGMSPDGTPLVANAQLPPTAGRLLAVLATYTNSTVAAPSVPPAMAGETLGGSPIGAGISRTDPAQPGTGTPAWSSPVGGSAVLGSHGSSSGAGASPLSLAPPPTTGSQPGLDQAQADLETTRQSIMETAAELGRLLDDSWRLYLALPEELVTNTAQPPLDKLDAVLERFVRVTQDGRYRVLTDRPEFQRLYQLLQVYRQQLRSAVGATTP